jgi:hypothetical protein
MFLFFYETPPLKIAVYATDSTNGLAENDLTGSISQYHF